MPADVVVGSDAAEGANVTRDLCDAHCWCDGTNRCHTDLRHHANGGGADDGMVVRNTVVIIHAMKRSSVRFAKLGMIVHDGLQWQ